MRLESVGGLANVTLSLNILKNDIEFQIVIEVKKGNRKIGPLIVRQQELKIIYYDNFLKLFP